MPVFPPTGGGGTGPISPSQLPPNINGGERYVSPDGNDTNEGDNWERPLKYLKTAWNQLQPIGGGVIYFADGTSIAADGKGLHIGQGAEFALIPGSVQAGPMRVVGMGEGSSTSFTTAPPQNLLGGAQEGSTEQDDPAIWISDSVGYPIIFENVVTRRALIKSIRVGWDYTRNGSGAIIKNAVSAASRAAGETEFTVTPYTFDIEKISRASDVVSVAYKLRTGQVGMIRTGMNVYVDFDNADFDPVAAEVTELAADSVNTFNVVKFPSVGANFSTGTIGGPSIGTLACTLVTERDYITLYVGVTEFPASQYRVLDSGITDETEASITVTDYYGYAPRSATASDTDIGTYAAQDRLRHNAARFAFKNVVSDSVRDDLKTEDFLHGPTMDIGSAIFCDFKDLYLGGFNIAEVGGEFGCRDPERRAGLLCDGGGGDSAVGFGVIDRYWGSYGGIRYHGSFQASAMFAAKNIIVDQPIAGFRSVPAVSVLEMAESNSLYLENVSMVDGQQIIPAVDCEDTVPAMCVFVNTAFGGIHGAAVVIGMGIPNLASDFALLPNQMSQAGYYGEHGNRILAGRHFSSARSGSLNANVLGGNNAFQDPDDWTTQNITVTDTGIRDPFGGTRAVRLTATNSGAFCNFRLLQGFTANVGDFWFGTVWMRRDTNLGRAMDLRVTNVDQDVTYLSQSGYYPRAEGAAGEWNPIQAGGYLTGLGVDDTDTAVVLQVNIENGEHVDVYLPSLWTSPVADRTDKVTLAEIGEIMAHQAPAPGYLLAGDVGTPAGVKVFGAGGFGTDSDNTNTAGVGSGQLTLTGTGTVYLPVYDLDGTTIIGWTALLQATVNP